MMMSNTSYQRAVQDMKLAGLNPMLAFEQGGASTPSGSQASHSGGESLGDTAMAAMRFKEELEQIREATATAKTQQELNKALEEKAKEEAKNTSVATAKTAATLPKEQTWGQIWEQAGKAVNGVLNEGNKALNKFRDSYNSGFGMPSIPDKLKNLKEKFYNYFGTSSAKQRKEK